MRLPTGIMIVLACVLLAAVVHRLENPFGKPDKPVAWNAPLPRTIHGDLTQNVGSLRVPPNTILHWHCPQCGPTTRYWAGSTFQIMNDETDPLLLLDGIDALGQRSGTEVLPGGTYHNVFVETTTRGWSLTFSREPTH